LFHTVKPPSYFTTVSFVTTSQSGQVVKGIRVGGNTPFKKNYSTVRLNSVFSRINSYDSLLFVGCHTYKF